MSYWTSNRAYGNYPYSSQTSSKISSNKPKGLINLTNTCYISSCLQILFRIIPESIKSGKVTNLFLKLKSSNDKYDYKDLKAQLEDHIEIVQGWEQQDANQFLLGFLEVLNRENCKRSPPGKLNLQYNQKQNVEKNWVNFVTEMKKIEDSDIINYFYGELIRQLKCEKGHIKHNFERYLQLSLSFPQDKSVSPYNMRYLYKTTLEQMINKEFKSQIIEDLECETCKRKMKFQKQTFLYTLPRYLILHLARFKKGYYSQQKIASQVQFDEYIRLKQYRTKEIVQYKLVGMVHHFGTLNRGHYFCELRVDSTWYQINDHEVTHSNIRSTGNSSKYVYLLFYERVK